MTEREAIYLLLRTNRRHQLLNTCPILTDEQINVWSQELRNGLLALAQAGYKLAYVNGPLRPHYVLQEPAENCSA